MATVVTTGLGLLEYYVKWSGAACLALLPAIEAVAGPSERGGHGPGPGGDTNRINEANLVLDLGGVY